MQRAFNSIFFTLPLVILGCLIPLSAQAQVTPDGTTSTTVNQDGNNFTIEQGDRVGDNLFHSFNQFSVPTLGSAAFNNAGDIANIFSRVTGSSISSIDGLISSNGAANLFLINPNGIIFGENASLNLGGSFFASTADSLLFEGNAEFSAVNPQAPPLLEVSIPIGANFRDNPGDITVNQSILEVSPGKNLALLGGNLSIEGGELGLIAAPGGRIELGGLSAAGEVKINENNSLTFPENIARGDVTLSNLALIDVSSDGEGSIAVNANNLELLGASSLEGGIASELGNANAQAGNINLNATGNINLTESSTVSNLVNNNGIGNSGNINIQARSLSLEDGGLVVANTLGGGNTGKITIKAFDFVSLDGGGIINLVEQAAKGNSGGIDITTANLSLTNGGQIDASTLSEGNAGKITIKASDSISVDGFNSVQNTIFYSTIFSEVDNTAKGDSEGIEITTTNLSLTNGGNINSNSSGNGNSGKISINAADTIVVDGSGSSIFNGIDEGVNGNSEGIEIATTNLSLTDGGQINASTYGQGDVGKITINASDMISVDGEDSQGFRSGIFSTVEETGGGNSGGIGIIADNLNVTNNGVINSSTFGLGDARKITIKASDSVFLDNGVIGSLITELAKGDSDGIDITTANLSLTNGGQIDASTLGEGNAGQITIKAFDSIFVDGSNSIIFSEVDDTATKGNAGNINIQAQSLSLEDGGAINSSTSSQGNGGTITIDVDDAVTITGASKTTDVDDTVIFTNVGESNSSQITTETFTFGEGDGETFTFGTGNAGNIKITAQSLSLEDGGAIDSSTYGTGNAGNITINVGDSLTLNGESPNKFRSTIAAGNRTMGFLEVGNGGNIKIKAQSLSLENGSIITSVTLGLFAKPGNITIDVDDSVTLNGENEDGLTSQIITDTFGTKNGGNIEIQGRSLSLKNGAKISSRNLGDSNGGNITINVDDSVILNGESKAGFGSAIFTDASGDANGGNIEIKASSLSLDNGAEMSSNIISESIDLEPASGQGGNINLEIADILSLRNNSKISAQALGDANGGNITANADLIIAFPNQNNDIFANAAQGNGGNINITTQGIFGLEERPSTPPNQTNDIDASSEFGLQGTFSLNTPDFDPTTGLINLPASVGDASDQISQNPCQRGVGSEFIITGKGGLPPNVNESLNSESAQVGLIETVTSQPQTVGGDGDKPALKGTPSDNGMAKSTTAMPTAAKSSTAPQTQAQTLRPNPSTTSEAVPAQGWVFNDQGEVTLTAYSTSGNKIQRSGQQQPSSCSSRIAP